MKKTPKPNWPAITKRARLRARGVRRWLDADDGWRPGPPAGTPPGSGGESGEPPGKKNGPEA